MHFGLPEGGLYDLLDRAECLLLDFDGPVCDLFHGSPASQLAGPMVRYLSAHGVGLDNPALANPADPHGILAHPWGPEVAAVLEAMLARGEEEAVESARPTRGASAFVRAVSDSGRLLAVTTNNAPAAVVAYLKNMALDDCFEWRIFGRSTDDPTLMKPHPDCLLRAVTAMAVRREDCLMIGDSLRDAAAAKAAGIPFLGYARTADRARALRAFDPHPVVVGMEDLATVAATLSRRPNG